MIVINGDKKAIQLSWERTFKTTYSNLGLWPSKQLVAVCAFGSADQLLGHWNWPVESAHDLFYELWPGMDESARGVMMEMMNVQVGFFLGWGSRCAFNACAAVEWFPELFSIDWCPRSEYLTAAFQKWGLGKNSRVDETSYVEKCLI